MEYAIDMRDVTKQYSGFKMEHMNFQVPKGCVVGLIGENGAGKTTLIKAVLGLIHIEEGEVYIQGHLLHDHEHRIKEDIGVVFDSNSFPDELKIIHIKKIMAALYKNWEEEVFDTLAKRMGLPYDQKIKTFSRGMKMKLNIAVALSHQAKLLILDEATGGLDPVVRDEILELFLEFMQDEEHSILITSHITSDIEKISDYIAFIKDGKTEFFMNKDDLIHQYGILKCSEKELDQYDASYFESMRKGAFLCEVLIHDKYEFIKKYPNCVVEPVTLETIMLFYVKGEKV